MENIEFRKGAVDAANCISEGWNLIKGNYWLFFVMCIVELIIVIAANAVPYLGGIINILVSGALACGIYITLLAQRRGENFPFSLMFEGFSRIFQTTLITLISSIPWFVYTAPEYPAQPGKSDRNYKRDFQQRRYRSAGYRLFNSSVNQHDIFTFVIFRLAANCRPQHENRRND